MHISTKVNETQWKFLLRFVEQRLKFLLVNNILLNIVQCVLIYKKLFKHGIRIYLEKMRSNFQLTTSFFQILNKSTYLELLFRQTIL